MNSPTFRFYSSFFWHYGYFASLACQSPDSARGAIAVRCRNEFAEKISLEAHQKAADYTITKTKFGLLSLFFSVIVCSDSPYLVAYNSYRVLYSAQLGNGMSYQIALIVSFVLISSILDLPSDYYRQFVIEEKFPVSIK